MPSRHKPPPGVLHRRQWWVEYKTADGPQIEVKSYLPKWILMTQSTGRKWLLPCGLSKEEALEEIRKGD